MTFKPQLYVQLAKSTNKNDVYNKQRTHKNLFKCALTSIENSSSASAVVTLTEHVFGIFPQSFGQVFSFANQEKY